MLRRKIKLVVRKSIDSERRVTVQNRVPKEKTLTRDETDESRFTFNVLGRRTFRLYKKVHH